jgi:hypothetical protein
VVRNLAAIASGALVVLILLRLRSVQFALHVYLVVLGGIALYAVAATVSLSIPSRPVARTRIPWRIWRRSEYKERLRSLESLEHAVDFASTTAFDVHYRLRPHLIEIAEHRLARSRGAGLEEPEAARARLGEEAWEVVRPGRPAPQDRNARGLSLETLGVIVERLESL